jgi:hypothetical protein
VGLPRHLGSRGSDSGRGPFGEKAFRGAVIGCVVLLIGGLSLVMLGGAAATALGASFLALGAVGLLTAAAGLVAERVLGRRPPPSREVRSGNGHSPPPPELSRTERLKRR